MKYRILHVSHSASLSGAEQALLRLVEHLDRGRFDSLVVLPTDGPLRAALSELGIETRVLPIRWWIPATHWSASEFMQQIQGLEERWRELARLAVREPVHLIHTNTVVTIEGALAAAALSLPHVWHSRGLFGNGFPPAYFDHRDFFYSVIDELGDHVVCVSKPVRGQASQYLRRTDFTVIPDGFDPSHGPLSTRAEFLAEFGLSAAARVIVSIGGVQRRKGQLDLIEALARVKADHPEAVLLLCGGAADNSYVDEVQGRIRDLALISCVRFLGFRSDVWNILHHSELVVQPSRSEGFGLAVLEAMAAGKPVIATRSGGPEDIIEDDISGLLVEPGAPGELAAAISSLLGDAGRAHRIADAAPKRAALFTAAASAREFQTLLEQVLTTTRSKPSGDDWPNKLCARVLEALSASMLD
jgi:glycosyltransferase involved in cell wall biosynthesis